MKVKKIKGKKQWRKNKSYTEFENRYTKLLGMTAYSRQQLMRGLFFDLYDNFGTD